MLLSFLVTWGTLSAWWVLPILLIAALYTWAMYKSPVTLGKQLRYTLAGLRFLTVGVIGLLLLSPMLRSVNYEPQKPLVLIAQDNSSSVAGIRPAGFNLKQFSSNLAKLKNELGSDYDVREFAFAGRLSNGLPQTFNGRSTDIAAALHQLNENYAGQNIGAVVLATDGLYNQGADPLYESEKIKTSIYTIALGDTTTRRDLLISNINYNKTALLGNDFVVELSVEAYLARGNTMAITAKEDGHVAASKNITIAGDNFRKTIALKLNAGKKGLHKFTFNIAPVSNETSLQNNTETIYVEVIDATQKILLVYGSPHPDISALRQSIGANRNYEIKAIDEAELPSANLGLYNLLVLYQAGRSNDAASGRRIAAAGLPTLVIAGAQTTADEFNNRQKLVKLNAGRVDNQEVFATPQADFTAFTLSDSTLQKIRRMPPLLAPFGSYNVLGNAAVLFRQKIGTLETAYPLMVFGDEQGRRTAVLAGEGLWRWQLTEFENYGSHNALNELVSQTVQYLTANAKRQRFRVYTAKNVFNEGEHVVLNAELYNEALTLTNTPDINLNFKSSTGKTFSYQFSRNGQSYRLDAGILPAGDYTYRAATTMGKETLTATGQLSIKATDLEARQSKANHTLLKQIAKTTGGEMILPAEVSRLAALIRNNENIKTIINEDRRYAELIDVKWVFGLILALLSAEWFLRKWEGEI